MRPVVLSALLTAGFDWAGRIEEVARDLDATESASRLRACQTLATLTPAAAAVHLRRALMDRDATVRACAARALLHTGDADVRKAIRAWTRDTDPGVRLLAVELSGEVGDRTAIARALADSAEEVRLAAVRALGRLGAEAAATAMGRLEDPSSRVRLAAIDVLVAAEDRRAAPLLVDRLGDAAVEVRRRACLALAELDDSRAAPALIRSLADPMSEVQAATAEALGRLRAVEAVSPLADRLAAADPAVRHAAIVALGMLGDRDPRAVGLLVEALGDKDLHATAEESLRGLGSAAVPALLEALGSSGTPLASLEAVVRLLGGSADPRALPPLLDVLRWGPVAPDLVIAAIGGLRQPAALEPLAPFLEDPDPAVRSAALRAVAPIADGRVHQALVGLLGDSSPATRAEAARVAGRLRIPAAGRALAERMDDSDPAVRTAATWALGEVGGSSAPAPLVDALKDDALAGRALAALARLRPPAAEAPLLRLLDASTGAPRAVALRALGAVLRDARRTPPGIAALLRDPDGDTRAAATFALAAVKDPRTPAAIERALPDAGVDRARVVEALSSFEAARPLLERLTRDPEAPARAAAQAALDRLRRRGAGWLLARIEDEDGLPLANTPVTMLFSDGRRHECRTDAAGYLAEERIPEGRVIVWLNDDGTLSPTEQDTAAGYRSQPANTAGSASTRSRAKRPVSPRTLLAASPAFP
jgi:HEAT repeat protein